MKEDRNVHAEKEHQRRFEEYSREVRTIYLDHRNALEEERSTYSLMVDRHVAAIGASALGLSFYVVTMSGLPPDAWLEYGWVALLLSLVLNFGNMGMTTTAHEVAVELADAQESERQSPAPEGEEKILAIEKRRDRLNKAITLLNRATWPMLLVGVGCVLVWCLKL